MWWGRALEGESERQSKIRSPLVMSCIIFSSWLLGASVFSSEYAEQELIPKHLPLLETALVRVT